MEEGVRVKNNKKGRVRDKKKKERWGGWGKEREGRETKTGKTGNLKKEGKRKILLKLNFTICTAILCL